MLRGTFLAVALVVATFASTASAHDQATFSFFGTDVGINVSHDLFRGFVFNDSHSQTHDFVKLDPSQPANVANNQITLNIQCNGVWRGWGVWFRPSQGLIAICNRLADRTTGGAVSIWKN